MNWATVADAMTTLTARAAHLAQALPATGPAGQRPPPWAEFFSSPMSLLAIGLLFLWIFMFSGKRKDEKKPKDLLNQIKRGDRVQTIGGIIGKVVEAEELKVLLKVDESSNTKIWFSRGAIAKVLGEEKAAEVGAK